MYWTWSDRQIIYFAVQLLRIWNRCSRTNKMISFNWLVATSVDSIDYSNKRRQAGNLCALLFSKFFFKQSSESTMFFDLQNPTPSSKSMEKTKNLIYSVPLLLFFIFKTNENLFKLFCCWRHLRHWKYRIRIGKPKVRIPIRIKTLRYGLGTMLSTGIFWKTHVCAYAYISNDRYVNYLNQKRQKQLLV